MSEDRTKWIDVTVPLSSGMVHWPGDPEPNFHRILEIEQGEVANVTVCRMSAHTGTHMDAPCHFLNAAQSIEQFPLETAVGPARVIDIPRSANVISDRELADCNFETGERVFFRTRNSDRSWHESPFQEDYVALDQTAAKLLAAHGVRLIGVDYLSVGLFAGDGAATHRILMEAGIWIVEGLDLSRVQAGVYDMICLPLPIAGSDGSPARVVLRPRSLGSTRVETVL